MLKQRNHDLLADATNMSLADSCLIDEGSSIPLSSTSNGNAPARTCISPLELLHPDGVISKFAVIGSNAPAVILPESRTSTGQEVDLLILAPTATECHTAGWLETAVWSLVRKVGLNGIAYILVPPPWRPKVKRLLRDHGWVIGPSILHLPNRASSRYLVPLTSITARFACSTVLPLASRLRRLALLALRFPGARKLLGNALPAAGFIARPTGARPLFAWLFQLDSKGNRSGSAIIARSWRSENGAVVVYRFLYGDVQPSAIAKMNLTTTVATKCTIETANLKRLGPTARYTGVRVPQPLFLGRIDDQPVLLQTVVEGRKVASLLASQPSRVSDIMECLVTWLERWNRTTVSIGRLDHELLQRQVIEPAVLLAPLIEQGKEYQDWLTARCAIVRGLQVPFVATHNDLTMWNILLDDQGGLGVVDWEAARAEGLPFVDFFYAVTDAVTATRGYMDRTKAFEECFARHGAYTNIVRKLMRRLRSAVDVSDEIAEVCFHACWLHHAVNEHRSTRSSAPRPFLRIVQSLALYRSEFSGWMNR